LAVAQLVSLTFIVLINSKVIERNKMEKHKDKETMNVKRLCTTDRPFKQIIQLNYLYVDKTKYIYDILNGYGYQSCFLFRPRRFGKTLLLDTMSELFQGNRRLFKDLWIGKSDYQFAKHPVLYFTMTYDDIKTSDDLKSNIKKDLKRFAAEHKMHLTEDSCSRMLNELLTKLYKRNNVGTVILVDEYDSPVTKHISNMDLALKNREVLHDFYQSMKTNIRYIHFAFVTGISRFGLTSLDSGANNFKDISLMSEFASICGFTKNEIIAFFSNRFPDTLKQLKSRKSIAWNAGSKALMNKIHEWYDGYNWLGPEHVYNPFSIMNFFDEKKLRAYWPLSGQPSHLSTLVRANPQNFFNSTLESYLVEGLMKVDLEAIEPTPLLFHSGYLTIDEEIQKKIFSHGKWVTADAFTFRPPNREVTMNLSKSLFIKAFSLQNITYLNDITNNLSSAILNKNSDKMVDLLHNLLSSLAPEHHVPSENHYHAVLHAAFLAAGFEVLDQTSSAHGRSDMTLFLNDKVRVVFELKYCKVENNSSLSKSAVGNRRTEKDKKAETARARRQLSAALGRGEKAIINNDYVAPYRAARKTVIALAVAIRGRDEVAVRFIDI
jgi:hypothetical protein